MESWHLEPRRRATVLSQGNAGANTAPTTFEGQLCGMPRPCGLASLRPKSRLTRDIQSCTAMARSVVTLWFDQATARGRCDSRRREIPVAEPRGIRMTASQVPAATVISDVASLVSAVVWPLVIVGVLWFLREPLRALAHRIGSSAQSVSIGAQGLTVELGSAVEPVPSQATTALAGVRLPEQAPRVVDSAALTMFAQLESEAPAPYLVVDLADGRDWLTSRLYIFAILLRAMRQTGALVFVESVGGVRGRFVGLRRTRAHSMGARARLPLARGRLRIRLRPSDEHASDLQCKR